MVSLDTVLCSNRCLAGEVSVGDVAVYGERTDRTLEQIPTLWTVDHISYVHTSMDSIPEGFSSGMWFVGEDVNKLSGYVQLFTTSPGSVPDILVLSQMVDMARRHSHELAAAARRLTSKREIERRVAAKVAVASKFDWTWTCDNIRQFCDIVGWHETSEPDGRYSIEDGGDLTTDIDVRWPLASLRVSERTVRYCALRAIEVSPLPDDDSEVTAGRIREEFNSLARVIESMIGPSLLLPPEMNHHIEVSWTFPKVVIRLRMSAQCASVWMVNPRYLAELDRWRIQRTTETDG
ncbi:DUF6301 family protein [Nocardia sp. NPDC058705]|uniref:DUF6301 family protein n=1 Tax=Nocardia sp. NPDC058705 TaxID=3346609 RepID=UPI0036CFAE21